MAIVGWVSPPATSSSVPATSLSSTDKHIQDINLAGFKETASHKVVKNSRTDDIVQAFTENGTLVEVIDTPSGHPDIIPETFHVFYCFFFFFLFLHVIVGLCFLVSVCCQAAD